MYAANNPSESLLAKRRAYATVVSHNVPPYARAGLYKDLLNLRGLLADLREETPINADFKLNSKLNSEATAPPPPQGDPPEEGPEGGGEFEAPSEESSSELKLTAGGALLASVLASGLDRDLPLPPEAVRALALYPEAERSGEAASEAAAQAIFEAGTLDEYCESLRCCCEPPPEPP